eukprot:5383246-Alexandrium_andersonii.AAC.1
MHRVRCHGHASQYATLINTSWCPACMRCVHEVRRAVHRVAVDAPKCRMLCLLYTSDAADDM